MRASPSVVFFFFFETASTRVLAISGSKVGVEDACSLLLVGKEPGADGRRCSPVYSTALRPFPRSLGSGRVFGPGALEPKRVLCTSSSWGAASPMLTLGTYRSSSLVSSDGHDPPRASSESEVDQGESIFIHPTLNCYYYNLTRIWISGTPLAIYAQGPN